jgi:hypothetical protein
LCRVCGFSRSFQRFVDEAGATHGFGPGELPCPSFEGCTPSRFTVDGVIARGDTAPDALLAEVEARDEALREQTVRELQEVLAKHGMRLAVERTMEAEQAQSCGRPGCPVTCRTPPLEDSEPSAAAPAHLTEADTADLSWRTNRAPCNATHPETKRLCQGYRGHGGEHWSCGPGYSDQWPAASVPATERETSDGDVA